MRPITIRGLNIGEGIPKICVPVLGETKEEILREARALTALPADLAEWRADWFASVFDFKEVKEVLAGLRSVLAGLPLLFTFRTAGEGGQRPIGKEAYLSLLQAVIRSRDADLVDVEAFAGDDVAMAAVAAAHACGIKVLASNHDFEKTPDREEIVRRLVKMQDLGADLLKIAVMPQKRADVFTLMAAAEEMEREHATRPVIAMSMSGMGAVTRLGSEAFGSSVVFAAAAKASAPGQMGAEEVARALALLHDCL